MKLFELFKVVGCDFVDVRDPNNNPLFSGYVENLMEDSEINWYSDCKVLCVTPETDFTGVKYLEINIC